MQNYIKVPRQEYPEYLERRLEEMFWKGRASWTLKDLSDYAKLPITPNMRRRVAQLVTNGCLLRFKQSPGSKQRAALYCFVGERWDV